MHLLVLVLRLAGAALDFRDEVSCPATAAVLDRLQRIAPEATAADHVVRLRRSGTDLLLQLHESSGVTLASRQLPASTDCAELAEVVAVTLAAWEAQFSHELPPASVPTSPAREVVSATTASQAGSQSAQGSTHRFGFAALVLATGDGQGAGVAVELEASYDWAVGLLLADSTHNVAFGSGELHWQRTALGAGGALHIAAGRWDLSGRAFILGAVLARWGSGYGVDETSFSPDLGAGAGIRAAFRLSRSVAILADLSGVTWPFTQSIVVEGVPGSFTLPIWEIYGGLGVSYEEPW